MYDPAHLASHGRGQAASGPAAFGFSTLRFRYPGLTGSDPLALAGPSSVLSPTRPLFKASLNSRFRRSSRRPSCLSDCGGFVEPRAPHSMSRSDGGALFSGDIPQASPNIHSHRTHPSRTARKGLGEMRRRGPRARPGSPGPESRTRRGKNCNRITVAVRDLLPRDALLQLGHYSCTLGRLGLTSSRLRSAPFPLSTLSSLGRPDPSRLA
jgi:hypothetical protein